jgi:hypothetical protein
MISKETLELFNDVISIMDSFQQDYGKCRYSATMDSFAESHLLTVRITYGYKAIMFAVDDINKGFLYKVFEMKTKQLLGEE